MSIGRGANARQCVWWRGEGAYLYYPRRDGPVPLCRSREVAMILVELLFGLMLAGMVLLVLPFLLLMAGIAGAVLLWVLAPAALVALLIFWLAFPGMDGLALLLLVLVIGL